MKYTKEERLILNRCKVKDVYDYVKMAIETYTIPEIEFAINIMDKRANYERNSSKRRIYRTIIKELKDLYILRQNETIDDLILSKDLLSLWEEIQELENKPNKTQLDIKRLKHLKKLLREGNEIDLYETERFSEETNDDDYNLNNYYDYD